MKSMKEMEELRKQTKEQNRQKCIDEIYRTGVFDTSKFSGAPISKRELFLKLISDKEFMKHVHTLIFDNADFRGDVEDLSDSIEALKDNQSLVRLEILNLALVSPYRLKLFLKVLGTTQIKKLRLKNMNPVVGGILDPYQEVMASFAESPFIQNLSSFGVSLNKAVGVIKTDISLLSLLLKSNFSELDLSTSFHSRDTIKTLCQILPEMTKLKKLNLSGLKIGNVMLPKLVESLTKLDLEELDLSDNMHPDKISLKVELLKPLLKKRTLRRLGFARNGIGTEGFKFLSSYFKGKSPITQIHLQGNQINLKKIKEELGTLLSGSAIRELGIVNDPSQNLKTLKEETEVIVELLGKKSEGSALTVFPLSNENTSSNHKQYSVESLDKNSGNIRAIAHAVQKNFFITSINHPYCSYQFLQNYYKQQSQSKEHIYVSGRIINSSLERNKRIEGQFFLFRDTMPYLGTHLEKNTSQIVLGYLDFELNYFPAFTEFDYEPLKSTDPWKTTGERLICRLREIHKGDIKKVQEEEEQERQLVKKLGGG